MAVLLLLDCYHGYVLLKRDGIKRADKLYKIARSKGYLSNNTVSLNRVSLKLFNPLLTALIMSFIVYNERVLKLYNVCSL